MLLWYTALSILFVATVFRSSGLDYRVIALGALLPVLVDLPRRAPGGRPLAGVRGGAASRRHDRHRGPVAAAAPPAALPAHRRVRGARAVGRVHPGPGVPLAVPRQRRHQAVLPGLVGGAHRGAALGWPAGGGSSGSTTCTSRRCDTSSCAPGGSGRHRTVIVLVRHGETDANRAGPAPRSGRPAAHRTGTPAGDRRRGRARAGGRTAPLRQPACDGPRDRRADRARRPACPPTVDDRLTRARLRRMGRASESPSSPPTRPQQWRADPTFAPPGGESLAALRQRVAPFAVEALDTGPRPHGDRGEPRLADQGDDPRRARALDELYAWRLRLDVASISRLASGPTRPRPRDQLQRDRPAPLRLISRVAARRPGPGCPPEPVADARRPSSTTKRPSPGPSATGMPSASSNARSSAGERPDRGQVVADDQRVGPGQHPIDCSSPSTSSRPPARRSHADGSTSRNSAMACNASRGDRSVRSASGVPGRGSKKLIGTSHGSSAASSNAKSTRCSSVSPRPEDPPAAQLHARVDRPPRRLHPVVVAVGRADLAGTPPGTSRGCGCSDEPPPSASRSACSPVQQPERTGHLEARLGRAPPRPTRRPAAAAAPRDPAPRPRCRTASPRRPASHAPPPAPRRPRGTGTRRCRCGTGPTASRTRSPPGTPPTWRSGGSRAPPPGRNGPAAPGGRGRSGRGACRAGGPRPPSTSSRRSGSPSSRRRVSAADQRRGQGHGPRA